MSIFGIESFGCGGFGCVLMTGGGLFRYGSYFGFIVDLILSSVKPVQALFPFR